MSESPILIARYFTANNVRRWVKLGYVCQVEVLDFYKTAKNYTVKWENKRISIYDGSEISTMTLQDIFKGSQCRALVFSGNSTFISKLYRIIGYCVVKLFQLIPKHINFEQLIYLYSLRFSGHRIRLVKTPHLLYHGTGLMALRFSPGLLKKASKGVTTVLVTGTNGKTTVTKMIHDGMKAAGIDAVWNPTGANMLGGIATSLFENLRFGRPHSKWAVVECDEAWLMDIAPIIKPEIIIVTNISVDSDLQRFKNTEITKSYIERAIREAKPKYVICGEELHLDISGNDSGITRYHNSDDLRCSIPGVHNLKNVAAACTCLKILGLDSNKVRNAISNTPAPYGRFETLDVNEKNISLILAKNPEAMSFNLKTLESISEKINLVFFVNDYIRNGSSFYSGWLTDGTISRQIKKINCDIFLGGSLCNMMHEHFHSEGLSPTILDSQSTIFSILDSKKKTYLLYNPDAMWEILRTMNPYRSAQQKYVF